MRGCVLLFSLLPLAFCLSASAATYYVDNASGSDSAAGTSSGAAWAHCPGDGSATGNANRTLAAGDTVIFHGGVTYTVASGKTIYANASGSAGSPITYLSGHLASPQWGTTPAVINGASAAADHTIDLSGYSYITVNGLTLVGNQGYPYIAQVGGSWSSGGNISILNCSMSNSPAGGAGGVYIQGLYGGATPANFIVSNNIIANTEWHGIFLRWGMSNVSLLNNTISNIGAANGNDCIALFGLDGIGNSNANLVIRSNDVSNATIKSPIIFQNYIVGALVEQNYFHGSFGYSGMDMDGCFTNLTIRNNVWDMNNLNYYGTIAFSTDQGTVYGDGIYIYNNTFRTTIGGGGFSQAAIYIGRGDNTAATAFWRMQITNNIVINSTSGDPVLEIQANSAGSGPIVNLATFGCDYNVYEATADSTPFVLRGTAYSLANWRTAISGDAHSVIGAPTFVSGTDLHLGAADTVARGAAVNLTGSFTLDKDSNTRPASGAWDIGAYEYQGGAGAAPGPVTTTGSGAISGSGTQQ